MNLRTIETVIAGFTLALLLVYFPVETWASTPRGLTNPFYLVDLIGMTLLFWSAVVSMRARPHSAAGVLCAGYSWTSANGWPATFGRAAEVLQGVSLEHGMAELWAVGGATVVAILCMCLTLWIIVRQGHTSGIRSPS
jgi:hypothetical protein